MPQLTHSGTCEAREGDSGRVQQLLHGESGGKLQGQCIPVHAAGVHHGRRALHLSAGHPSIYSALMLFVEACNLCKI